MINQTCLNKVSKLLPMLTSNKPGEVVGAATALVRVLNSHNSNIHEIVDVLNQPVTKTEASDYVTLEEEMNVLVDRVDALTVENTKLRTNLHRAKNLTETLAKIVVMLLVGISVMYLTR